MTRHFRNILTAVAFAIVTFVMTGCGTTHVNSAPFYFPTKGEDAVYEDLQRQYREAKALEDAKKARASYADGQRNHTAPHQEGTQFVVKTEDAPLPNHPNNRTHATQPQHQSQPRHASNTVSRVPVKTNAMRPINLYGQVRGARGGVASPMDSPSNVRQISFTTEGADFDPEIDPTGQFLIFASTRHRKTADIYLQKIGGTSVTQLTDDSANDVMPAISPDGTKIAFCSDRSGNWNIYIMDLTGNSPPVQLTSDLSHEVHPSFSPDGKRLVYSAFGAQTGQWELAVVELSNPTKTRYICNGLNPAWSPTENKILFQRARERGTKWFSIWTIDYKDGEGIRPTEIVASDNAAAITPSWSPDVWMVDTNGKGKTNLTNSRFVNVQPIWANGGPIYFVSNRSKSGIENIWSMSPSKPLAVARSLQEPKKDTATVSVPTDNFEPTDN